MKTREFIRGNVFIVPNAYTTLEENFDQETLLKVYQFINYGLDKPLDRISEEKFIQVWYVTPGDSDSNWRDHGIDGYNELKGYKPISIYLPVSLFRGYKEGDTITVNLPITKNTRKASDIDAVKVSLTLKQKDYRYGNFGKFEEVLERIVNR